MNAKELELSKLNATTSTLGMYIYGVCIGMDFKEIASIFMSDLGLMFSEILDGNQFTGNFGTFSMNNTFNYFELGPNLSRFDEKIFVNNKLIESPLTIFSELLEKKYKVLENKKQVKGKKLIMKLASDVRYSLSDKIKMIESFRSNAPSENKYKFNQLIDFIKEYFYQWDIVLKNRDKYNDLKVLAEGA